MYLKPYHPWHNVSPGKDIPQTVNGVIEIPKGSKGKYELDKASGLLRLDRVLYSSVHYPANYGFIPRTYCDDKDPLDILVIYSIDVAPLSLIESKVIGVMHMIDDDEQDDKIIAVANNDMAVNYINDISEFINISCILIDSIFTNIINKSGIWENQWISIKVSEYR